MKYFGLLILIFVSQSWAQSSSPLIGDIVSRGLSVLENPAEHANQQCTPNEQPQYCQNVVAAVCDFRKPQDSLREMEDTIREQFFGSVDLKNASSAEIREGSSRAIVESENQTFNRSPINREDMSSLFDELKSNLRSLINSNPNISDAMKPQMIERLEGSTLFVNGMDFIQSDIARQAAFPDRSMEERIDRSHRMYERFCGPTGLNVNAFNVGGKIHLCPGLLVSLIDRNPSRQEFLNALAFTVGHELSHSIGPQEFPDAYARMGECYNNLNNDPNYWNGLTAPEIQETPIAKGLLPEGKPTAGHNHGEEEAAAEPRNEETAADFWGAQLLASRIASQGVVGQDMIRTIGHASDDFCGSNSGPQYAPGNDRINLTIARNPTIRESLGCSGAGSAPVCDLSGTFNNN